MCKNFGLKPTASGCTKVLSEGGWSKGTKDEALALLCDAGILSNADCDYYQAGGAAPAEGGGTNLTKIFVGFFILLAILVIAAIIYKRYKK